MKRRSFIQKSSMLTAAAAMPLSSIYSFPVSGKKGKLGFALASYAIRWKSEAEVRKYPGFQNAIDILNHCQSIGADGIQASVSGWGSDFAGKVRGLREKYGMYLEGQIQLPGEYSEIDRFEKEIKAGMEAGAQVIRTVCLNGRRYENFDSMDSFEEFKRKSIRSLQWAEPIVRKHKVKLAVENHKDWRADEMVELMKKIDSEWIGVTLDTGNNISFMEDPMAVIETLAPYAFSTHIKDMAYKKYEEGILLSEVPLGEGIVDLKRAVNLCQTYHPEVTFNIETITRNPLRIPCLTDKYWRTFDHPSSGKELANILRTAKSSDFELPTVIGKSQEAKLAFEEENNLKSLQYARKVLEL